AVVTTWLVNSGRGRYAPVTLLPMLFVATTTSTTAYREITGRYWRFLPGSPPDIAPAPPQSQLKLRLDGLVVSCVLVILVSAVFRWLAPAPVGPDPAPVEASSEL